MSAGQKFGSFLNKAKSTALAGANTAIAAGTQAGGMLKDTSSRAMSSTSTPSGGGQSSLMQGFSLPGETDKAAKILASFLADPGHPEGALNAIPKRILEKALGLAVFTIVKAGFVFSGKAGSGLVIARLQDGSWSAPSCIATAGLGWGLQIGADITEFVVVLNSDDAVRAFSQGGNVTIGGNISAAAGPIGTGAQITSALQHPAPMFSYSRSKGLFAGLSLEGTVFVERKEANRAFYGSSVSAKDILLGRVPAPEIASRMYEIIEAAEGLDESGLPSESYIPGAPQGAGTGVGGMGVGGTGVPAGGTNGYTMGPAGGGTMGAGKTVFDAGGVH